MKGTPLPVAVILLEVLHHFRRNARVALRRLSLAEGQDAGMVSVSCPLPPALRYCLATRSGQAGADDADNLVRELELVLAVEPLVVAVDVSVLDIRDLRPVMTRRPGLVRLRTLRPGVDRSGAGVVVVGGSLELVDSGESWHWEGGWSEPARPRMVTGEEGFLAPTPEILVRACMRSLGRDFSLDLEIEAEDAESASVERVVARSVSLPMTPACSLEWSPAALARDVSWVLGYQPMVRHLMCPVSMMKVPAGDPVDWDENLEPVWDHPVHVEDEVRVTITRVDVRQDEGGRWGMRPRGTLEGRRFRLLSRSF